MTNGINFDQGLSISGTWENKRTGEIVSVKDCLMEDNQIVIVGTNGKLYNYDKFQEFIQISNEIKPNLSRSVVGKNVNKLTNNVDNYYSDVNSINNNMLDGLNIESQEFYDPTIFDEIPQSKHSQPIKQDSPISIALKNLPESEKPEIIVNIKWENRNIVEFLNKYMGANFDQISEELINEFCDVQIIKEELTNQIKSIINPLSEDMKPKRGRKSKEEIDPKI